MTRTQATVITVLVSAVLVVAFLWMVAAYWSFNRIGTSGANGFALVIVVLPVLSLVFALVAIALHVVVYRRTQSWGMSTVIAISGLIAAFVLLFILEVQRTKSYPTEEKRTLGEFVHHIVGSKKK